MELNILYYDQSRETNLSWRLETILKKAMTMYLYIMEICNILGPGICMYLLYEVMFLIIINRCNNFPFLAKLNPLGTQVVQSKTIVKILLQFAVIKWLDCTQIPAEFAYPTEPKCALGLALWMNMVYSLAGCIDKHNMTETVLFTTTL